MEELLLTKLMPPEFGSWLLSRERLLKVILRKKSGTHIVIITAPAGYGKTVLSQQLSRKLDKPLVWLQLDRFDNDPAVFLRYLVEGLRQHWPGLGEKVLQLGAKGDAVGKNPRLIASLLINDLVRARSKPLLVLDDAHVLTEPAIHDLLQDLLDNFPPGVYTVIASRTPLPLNLSRLHAAGTVRYIGAVELSFSRDEIAELLAERYGPQPLETVKEVEQFTGGWPVALELAERLVKDENNPKLKYSFNEASTLFNYLAAEVLDKQPPDHREFLLKSAVLETLTPEECNRLLEREDSSAILENLANKQQLLIPLAGREKAYRLHQLFREFLLQRLGNRRHLLQRRAGHQAALDGDTEKAVEYFLLAGFDAEAENVLEQAGRGALVEGRWHSVARWLEQLSDRQVGDNPWLSYFRAAVEAYRGRLHEAERWVESASSVFTKSKVNDGLLECRLLQARLMRSRGRYRDSLAMLDQAAELKEETTLQRFDFILEKGYNLFLSGDLQGAERFLTTALEPIRQSGNMQAATYLTEALGNICYQQGKHTKAMQLYQWCMGVSARDSLPGYYVQDAIPYIYCDWGELEKALELAQKYLIAKERYQLVESLPSAYSTLAYVYFEMGDYAKVEDLIKKALELHYLHGEERFFLLLNQMVLAWCQLARGHWVEARQLVDKTLAAAEEQVDQVCSMVQMLAGTALALMGNLAEAGNILLRSEANLKAMNFRIRLCDAYKALAYVYYASGDMKAFQKYARKFLHLSARMNYVCNRLQFTAELLEPILRFGLEQDVEVLYAQRVLSRLGPRSHKLLLELAGHPNPAVRGRIIAPLAELADEGMVQELRKLAQDSAPEVRQSTLAYLRLKANWTETAFTRPVMQQAAGPLLEVRTFGPLRFFKDGTEITGWRTRKTHELFGLLVHLGEPTGKERLKEELWPDMDPQSSNALFGTTIYYLRRRLEQEGLKNLIQYHQDRYSVKPGALSIDCTSFEELVNAGLQQGPLQELGAGLLEKAINFYRGDYMADPDDFAWALPRQVRLKHLYSEALLTLSRYYFSRRNYSRAQDYLLKLKEADPLSEPAHRLLLKIYANLGRKQTLAKEHRNFKLLLIDETGLPPAPETEALFQRLVNTN